MFTGIVEEVGRISGIRRRAGYQETTVACHRVLEALKVGDSLCVSGACHTAVSFDAAGFTMESVDETLQRTTIGRLRNGSRVNLERSLRLSDRLGGHLVAGHVDGIGQVLQRRESGDNVVFRIGVEDGLSRYIAEKGSVAIDGISLTVASAGDRDFSVALIPHTLTVTTMGERRPGDAVNVEVDTIARYIERLMRSDGKAAYQGLTGEALQEMGFAGR
jgi:riboflavin synthase